MANINIMVVDDQQLVRRGLIRLLGDMPGFTIVGEAECGERALETVETLMENNTLPDVVLMDLRMPGIGGLEATRKILRRFEGIRVVAVTGCEDHPFPRRCLDSGATAVVTKDASIDEMAKAIRMACSGKRYLSQKIAQDLALKALEAKEESYKASPFEVLSERELQIAMMIMGGIKTNGIAEKLSLSPKSVSTYRYRMFDKLSIGSNMELALLGSQHGLLEIHGQA